MGIFLEEDPWIWIRGTRYINVTLPFSLTEHHALRGSSEFEPYWWTTSFPMLERSASSFIHLFPERVEVDTQSGDHLFRSSSRGVSRGRFLGFLIHPPLFESEYVVFAFRRSLKQWP